MSTLPTVLPTDVTPEALEAAMRTRNLRTPWGPTALGQALYHHLSGHHFVSRTYEEPTKGLTRLGIRPADVRRALAALERAGTITMVKGSRLAKHGISTYGTQPLGTYAVLTEGLKAAEEAKRAKGLESGRARALADARLEVAARHAAEVEEVYQRLLAERGLA
jgi:hypothetical protein